MAKMPESFITMRYRVMYNNLQQRSKSTVHRQNSNDHVVALAIYTNSYYNATVFSVHVRESRTPLYYP